MADRSVDLHELLTQLKVCLQNSNSSNFQVDSGKVGEHSPLLSSLVCDEVVVAVEEDEDEVKRLKKTKPLGQIWKFEGVGWASFLSGLSESPITFGAQTGIAGVAGHVAAPKLQNLVMRPSSQFATICDYFDAGDSFPRYNGGF